MTLMVVLKRTFQMQLIELMFGLDRVLIFVIMSIISVTSVRIIRRSIKTLTYIQTISFRIIQSGELAARTKV